MSRMHQIIYWYKFCYKIIQSLEYTFLIDAYDNNVIYICLCQFMKYFQIDEKWKEKISFLTIYIELIKIGAHKIEFMVPLSLLNLSSMIRKEGRRREVEMVNKTVL